jgi:hypothetical protein
MLNLFKERGAGIGPYFELILLAKKIIIPAKELLVF